MPAQHLTRSDIETGLRQIGLARGIAVEVHSSLSSFGWVEGGSPAVVSALMNAVGEQGTLVMSAYPVSKPLPLADEEKARGILAKVRIYGEDYTGATGMGAIADEFRNTPGTVMGKGIHRVCAWGRDAGLHIQGYQYLLEIDGWVLLLGVGIDRCSSMHQAERVALPEEVTRYTRVPEEIRSAYPEDLYIAYGATPENGWEKVRAEAERRGLIRRHKIGNAHCMYFKARSVVEIYEQALRTDPLGLFGVPKIEPRLAVVNTGRRQ